MTTGTKFVLYGVATIAGNRLAVVADYRVKVDGSFGSKSLGRVSLDNETWPNTADGQRVALARVGAMNAETATAHRLHESNMAKVSA